eukprot:2957288-Karenia_brevis.AAC.1
MAVGLEDAINAIRKDQQLVAQHQEPSQPSFAHFTPSSLRKEHLQVLSESSGSSSSSSEDLEVA